MPELPRTTDRPESPADAPPVGAPLADDPGRVLVVDDDPANRESLARRLARRGYAVATAADGPAALAAVGAGAFDVVLLDVMMPGMSGLEVLSAIRQTRPPTDLPVVMATARDAAEDVVGALELGANDYVTKPLDFPVVLARVRAQVSLARSVRRVTALERQLSRRNAELEAANAGLRRAAEQARRDVELAARVQATFLPRDPPFGDRLGVAWRYRPCHGLAGDALNVCRLDDDHAGVYLLDVSGHGVGASLTAVAAARLLAPGHDPDSILVRPDPAAEVVAQLARRFAWNPDAPQFITLFYAVVHLPTRRLTYASAGHPTAVRVGRGGAVDATLASTGLPVGIVPDDACEQRAVQLAAGDRVYVYSDGVVEATAADGEPFGFDRLVDAIARSTAAGLDDSVRDVLGAVDRWRGDRDARDDVSVLAVECP